MIKAAFFDIDGTLMAHSLGCVPEDTRRALEELKKRGVRVFTCTGRHILELDELGLTSLGFDGHVLLNGQLCLDGARRILLETPVPREDIERILPVFEERRIPIAFVEKDRIYINFIDDRVRAAQKAISSELPETDCWAGGAVYLVNIFAEDETVLRALERMPRCRMTRWNPYGVDIIAEGGSKAKGMERLLAHFGAAREETIAFGDGENDMEMLGYAGIGVAMGNAEEKVKACADYVTEAVDRGGILSALRHFDIL